MRERLAQGLDLEPDHFDCRPRSLWSFFGLRDQGPLPPPNWIKPLSPLLTIILPLTETMLLACFPMILLAFLFQFILSLKPPHEPTWVRPLYIIILAVSWPLAIWKFWFRPRNDFVSIFERHLSWRVSLSRWEWFSSSGCLDLKELAAFSYRSDGFVPEPIDCGKTTSEILARLLLDIRLSRHDLEFHLKNGKTIVVEKFLARFETDDVRMLFNRLETFAERQEIEV